MVEKVFQYIIMYVNVHIGIELFYIHKDRYDYVHIHIHIYTHIYTIHVQESFFLQKVGFLPTSIIQGVVKGAGRLKFVPLRFGVFFL